MRVLITWGSQRGGTAEIAELIGEQLEREGFDVVLSPAARIQSLAEYDAVVIGGALYANRWHADARRFVKRHVHALRGVPVWAFSSGPLDASADQRILPPTRQVSTLLERIGAVGHVTFGGRLRPDARGFPASAMARSHAGDWRNPERIGAWATELAGELRSARPGVAIDHPAGSLGRLIGHGVAGWAALAALVAAMLLVAGPTAALVVRALAAPIVFAAVGYHYFHERGARDPRPASLSLAAILVALELTGAGVASAAGVDGLAPAALVTRVFGYWLAVVLAAAVTGLIGFGYSTLPWPERADAGQRPGRGARPGSGRTAPAPGR